MKHILIGLLIGLLPSPTIMACNPCFVRRAVTTTYIAPAVPVVPVSTVLIAQFAPTYLTVPTFSVGSVGYGVGANGLQGIPAGQPGAIPGTSSQPPALQPAQQQPQQPNGPQPGGMSSGGNPPAAPSENERILALLSAMEARLTALEAKLPPAQPPPAAEPAKTPEKPVGPPAPGEKQSRANTHQPAAALGKCSACHTGATAEGGLDLSAGLERLTSQQLTRVIARTANSSMPPRKQQNIHAPLTAAEFTELAGRVQYLQQTARR